jgi:hypothetical protein
MAAKRGPKPKDLSVYLEEAYDEQRRFPKLKAHAIGKRIAAKHPEIKGLDQAIRKALRKEEEKQATSTALDLPAPAPPAPSPSSPALPPLVRPAATMPRRRFKSAAQLAQEAYEKTLEYQLKLLKDDVEKTSTLRHLMDQDQKVVEALMRDPTFMELLRRIQEDDDE